MAGFREDIWTISGELADDIGELRTVMVHNITTLTGHIVLDISAGYTPLERKTSRPS